MEPTTSDLGSASQNETLLLACKTSGNVLAIQIQLAKERNTWNCSNDTFLRVLDPDPTENTADNSVIAGTSNSSSSYGYTRSTRKCKSSVGSYAIKGKIEY